MPAKSTRSKRSASVARTPSRARKLHKRLHTHCTFDLEQVERNEKAPISGAFAEPSDGLDRRPPPYRFTSNPSLSLDVFGKTEAAGQRGVGEEGDLVDLAAAQGEHHHAPGLRAHVVAEGRLAVGAGRA